jgi:uncharacterized protein (DUF924 family)
VGTRWRFGRGMKHTSGRFLFRPFQHSADREDPAIAVEVHRLLADEAPTRGASAHHAIIIDPLSLLSRRNTILCTYSCANEARAAA